MFTKTKTFQFLLRNISNFSLFKSPCNGTSKEERVIWHPHHKKCWIGYSSFPWRLVYPWEVDKLSKPEGIRLWRKWTFSQGWLDTLFGEVQYLALEPICYLVGKNKARKSQHQRNYCWDSDSDVSYHHYCCVRMCFRLSDYEQRLEEGDNPRNCGQAARWKASPN